MSPAFLPLCFALSDTPAEVLLRMVGCLLHNQLPQLRDILLIRTAVLQRQNIYESMYNATGFIKGANLDVSGVQAAGREACRRQMQSRRAGRERAALG